MSRLTKGEKLEIKKLNFEELFFNARKYYNTAEVNFQKVYEFYMMQPNHIEITYCGLRHFYKMSLKHGTAGFNYMKEKTEPYIGHNKVILYYLKQLEPTEDKY